jgi:hypothetical protein
LTSGPTFVTLRPWKVAKPDAVEIKVTIRPDQELRAERAMELNEDTAEVLVTYFYDTPELALFEAEVALRARLVKGDDDDSTVKFRPVEPTSIAEEWRRLKGFKLEEDCVGDRVACSASLTVLQKRDEITDVPKGERPIEKLFSKDRERFLREFYKGSIDFGALHVLGPIRVLRGKLTPKGFPHELTLEEWKAAGRRGARRSFDQDATGRCAPGHEGLRRALARARSRPGRRPGRPRRAPH